MAKKIILNLNISKWRKFSQNGNKTTEQNGKTKQGKRR